MCSETHYINCVTRLSFWLCWAKRARSAAPPDSGCAPWWIPAQPMETRQPAGHRMNHWLYGPNEWEHNRSTTIWFFVHLKQPTLHFLFTHACPIHMNKWMSSHGTHDLYGCWKQLSCSSGRSLLSLKWNGPHPGMQEFAYACKSKIPPQRLFQTCIFISKTL